MNYMANPKLLDTTPAFHIRSYLLMPSRCMYVVSKDRSRDCMDRLAGPCLFTRRLKWSSFSIMGVVLGE